MPKKKMTKKAKTKSRVTHSIQLTIEPTRCEIIQTDSTGRTNTIAVGANGVACSTSCRQVRSSAMINGLPLLVEVNAAYALFREFEGCEPTQKIGSYQLKHWAERWLKTYLSNGSCIAASALAGFLQDFDPQSINSVVRCPVALLREMGERTQRKPGPKLPVVVFQQQPQAG